MKSISSCADWRIAFLLLFLSFSLNQMYAQKTEPQFFDSEKQMIQETQTSLLLENGRRDSASYAVARNLALEIALKNRLPIHKQNQAGSMALQGFDDSGLLTYNASNNAISAAVLRTTDLHPGGGADLSLTGAGRSLGVWEVGRARLTHQEFGGRMTQADNSSIPIDDHANHVSGTMIAAGIDSDAQGMAYEANLRAYDSNNDVSEMGIAAASPTNLRVSNHSYGWICGWDYDDYQGQPTWYWWGNPTISSNTDYKFGQYDSRARDFDQVVYNAPFYLPVVSAGNDRNDAGPTPGGQHVVRNASNQWVFSNAVRQADGGNLGYDCLPPTQCAKNILTVGAVEAEAFDDLIVSDMSTFSSWGPTDDGRIKPDIVARGVDVYSCGSIDNSDYYFSSGTSMAAPSVTGSLLLLLEHYTNLNPGFTIRASALKGLVIHTASDAEGPDYQQGWGMMNTRAAADLMSHSFNSNSKDRLVSRDSVSNGGQREYVFYYDGNGPLSATVVWTDPAGPVSPNTLNPTTVRLINDLDIRLIKESDNTTYFPWILNPGNPSGPASKGDNVRDNVEQIFEENLPQGRYILRVNHKGSLSGGVQFYSFILSGRSNLITACSGTITDGSTDNYLSGLSHSWTISPPNAATVTLNFTSFNTENVYDYVRVYDGTSSNDPLLGEFSGTTLPPTLTALSGKMYLVFETDESVNRPGWSATYSCSDAQLSVSTNSLSSGAGANTSTFNISANCNWSISGVPSWLTVSPLSGNSNTPIQVNYSANNLMSTRTATLQISGCNGIVLTVEVTQFGCSTGAAPSISASGPTSLCAGESVTLSASNVCSGCTVNWSNGQNGASITVSTPGNYSATVANNCGQSPASNTIAITLGAAPNAPSLSASGPTSLCAGESVTLSASNVCSGCTVNWSNGQNGASITVSTPGNYSATVGNNCGQSLASNSITVTLGAAPNAPNLSASGPTSLCAGESVTLTASNVCSGCTVNWSNGQSGASITVSTPGNYSATVGNNCGQSPASNTIAVTLGAAPNAPSLSASGPTSLCAGESVTLTASNVCSGCTVNWSNGQSGASITVSTPGNYSATVGNNCGQSPASNVVEVSAAPPFLPSIQVNNNCHLAASTGSNYQWYLNGTLIPGATGQFWSAQSTGYYVVTMINPAGCSGSSDPVFAEACVSNTTRISEQLLMTLSPNPAKHRITLDLQASVDLSDVRLELYGFDGRYAGLLLQSETLEGNSTSVLWLPELPAGMYYYRLSCKQGSAQGNLLIVQ